MVGGSSTEGLEASTSGRNDSLSLMPPPPPRQATGVKKRRMEVLEEDDYTAHVEAIIERDFFPHLPKLASKLEWLEALNSEDPAKIRAAQRNIAARRAGMRVPSSSGGVGMGATPTPLLAPDTATPGGAAANTPCGSGWTPGIWTPGTAAGNWTPGLPGETPGEARDAQGAAAAGPGAREAQDAAKMSLDEFLTRYTTEDNASFSEVLEADNARRAARAHNEWMHKSTRGTDGGGRSGTALLGWRYTPKNTLMYGSGVTGTAALTAADRAAMVQGPPKQTVYANTRFHDLDTAMGLDEPDPAELIAEPSPHIGGAPRVSYQELKTPTVAPGGEGDASPMMTWGEIASTPLPLEPSGNATPSRPSGPTGAAAAVTSGKGASYAPLPRRPREEAALALGRAASQSVKRKAAAQAGATPASLARAHALGMSLSTHAHRSKQKRSEAHAGAASPFGADIGLGVAYGAGATPRGSTPRGAASVPRSSRRASVARRAPSVSRMRSSSFGKGPKSKDGGAMPGRGLTDGLLK